MKEDKRTTRELGAQLRCPMGPGASAVGDLMYASNAEMISRTIDQMNIQPDEHILEIGFGSGKHLPYLFSKAKNLHYYGLEISMAMIKQAEQYNEARVASGTAQFLHSSVDRIDPKWENTFHRCFAVNSIYFWDDPLQSLQHIYDLLNTNGEITLTFIEKEFGEALPFTDTGFRFVGPLQVHDWLEKAKFKMIKITDFLDAASSKDGKKLNRPYHIAQAFK